MIKYIAIVDYKARTGKGFGKYDLEAKTPGEAILEAEDLKNEDVYLIKIAKKEGPIVKKVGCKCSVYKEILCRREKWRDCKEAGERSCFWERQEYKTFVEYELIPY